MHNREAPNEHNRLCSQRSMWDVITSTEDFSGGANPPRPGLTEADLMPTFNVVQAASSKNFVLVLDTSGSMADSVSLAW